MYKIAPVLRECVNLIIIKYKINFNNIFFLMKTATDYGLDGQLIATGAL